MSAPPDPPKTRDASTNTDLVVGSKAGIVVLIIKEERNDICNAALEYLDYPLCIIYIFRRCCCLRSLIRQIIIDLIKNNLEAHKFYVLFDPSLNINVESPEFMLLAAHFLTLIGAVYIDFSDNNIFEQFNNIEFCAKTLKKFENHCKVLKPSNLFASYDCRLLRALFDYLANFRLEVENMETTLRADIFDNYFIYRAMSDRYNQMTFTIRYFKAGYCLFNEICLNGDRYNFPYTYNISEQLNQILATYLIGNIRKLAITDPPDVSSTEINPEEIKQKIKKEPVVLSFSEQTLVKIMGVPDQTLIKVTEMPKETVIKITEIAKEPLEKIVEVPDDSEEKLKKKKGKPEMDVQNKKALALAKELLERIKTRLKLIENEPLQSATQSSCMQPEPQPSTSRGSSSSMQYELPRDPNFSTVLKPYLSSSRLPLSPIWIQPAPSIVLPSTSKVQPITNVQPVTVTSQASTSKLSDTCYFEEPDYSVDEGYHSPYLKCDPADQEAFLTKVRDLPKLSSEETKHASILDDVFEVALKDGPVEGKRKRDDVAMTKNNQIKLLKEYRSRVLDIEWDFSLTGESRDVKKTDDILAKWSKVSGGQPKTIYEELLLLETEPKMKQEMMKACGIFLEDDNDTRISTSMQNDGTKMERDEPQLKITEIRGDEEDNTSTKAEIDERDDYLKKIDELEDEINDNLYD